MPVIIKVTAMILRNQCSNVFMLSCSLPIPETAYASIQAIIITGTDVAMAKITGRYKPEGLDKVNGTSSPK